MALFFKNLKIGTGDCESCDCPTDVCDGCETCPTPSLNCHSRSATKSKCTNYPEFGTPSSPVPVFYSVQKVITTVENTHTTGDCGAADDGQSYTCTYNHIATTTLDLNSCTGSRVCSGTFSKQQWFGTEEGVLTSTGTLVSCDGGWDTFDFHGESIHVGSVTADDCLFRPADGTSSTTTTSGPDFTQTVTTFSATVHGDGCTVYTETGLHIARTERSGPQSLSDLISRVRAALGSWDGSNCSSYRNATENEITYTERQAKYTVKTLVEVPAGKQLKVQIWTTFTPADGGDPVSEESWVTLTAGQTESAEILVPVPETNGITVPVIGTYYCEEA